MAQKKKILITWGLWYIGSHTATVFIENWYDVIIVDNLSNSHESTLDGIKAITWKAPKFYELDLRNYSDLDAVFEKHASDIALVIHFAAKKAVWESCQDPFLYYDHNILGTINLLKAMNKYHVNQIIFSSSATVYDAENLLPPFSETDRTKTTNPYWTTKLVIENLLRDMVMQKSFSAIALRYFNPIGAHESGMIGEDPQGIPNNLMPYVAQVAVGRRDKLTIYGNDYPTPDGTCRRDYIHVVDLAKGHVKAIDYAFTSKGVEIFNLGTGNPYSVTEIVTTFERVNNIKIKYEYGKRRAGDLPESYANADKAYKILGWKTEKTLDDMCKDLWRWQSMNPNGYKK